jgi:hypothetical protein
MEGYFPGWGTFHQGAGVAVCLECGSTFAKVSADDPDDVVCLDCALVLRMETDRWPEGFRLVWDEVVCHYPRHHRVYTHRKKQGPSLSSEADSER